MVKTQMVNDRLGPELRSSDRSRCHRYHNGVRCESGLRPSGPQQVRGVAGCEPWHAERNGRVLSSLLYTECGPALAPTTTAVSGLWARHVTAIHTYTWIPYSNTPPKLSRGEACT